jgi:hypothetical protein
MEGKVAHRYRNLALLPANIVPGVVARVQSWKKSSHSGATGTR